MFHEKRKRDQVEDHRNHDLIDPASDEMIRFIKNPPIEVRTSSKSENRPFSVSIEASEMTFQGEESVQVVLTLLLEDESQDLSDSLGGETSFIIRLDEVEPHGYASHEITNLTTQVSSLRFKEQEFIIKATVHTKGSTLSRNSTSFYSYSHQNVLKRRQNIKLEAISPRRTDLSPCQMHIVGQPFVSGPKLAVVFFIFTLDGETLQFYGLDLKFYSDSVIFFKLPFEEISRHLEGGKVIDRCVCKVTNDGRHFSNSLDLDIHVSEHVLFNEIFMDIDSSQPHLLSSKI